MSTLSTVFNLPPVPNATPQTYLLYILFAISLLVAASWPYFRSRYPCFTTSGLTVKGKKVDQVYEKARANLSLVRFHDELEDKEHRLSDLKRNASQTRLKELDLDRKSRSLLKIYLGFYPSLISEIIACYNEADDLERDIQALS
ncbi:hypothetical protein Moror_1393 [Moniliophthora roreri MCA 2997]|uniref:Uncharacterized protein n=2 Tax=Moniliophthora roreri TaxID=221103 RepID=V2XTX7_MONRO|nr:hypothetical protein Moror_1393 [Moniliophthora roreri MCA 2997]KAI3597585.1 hypothetical protein WG66_003151 [Moniliophthora roreri]